MDQVVEALNLGKTISELGVTALLVLVLVVMWKDRNRILIRLDELDRLQRAEIMEMWKTTVKTLTDAKSLGESMVESVTDMKKVAQEFHDFMSFLKGKLKLDG